MTCVLWFSAMGTAIFEEIKTEKYIMKTGYGEQSDENLYSIEYCLHEEKN